MYEVQKDGIRWKNKPLKSADRSSFEILTETLAQDASTVYMLGKPILVDRTSFEILSAGYARDCETLYQIMPAKLKPVKFADPASFVAIGDSFGHDAATCFFREKRLRIGKDRILGDLRSFGHVYGTDGKTLYFGTEKHPLPKNVDGREPNVQLKWFDDDEINLPFLALTDGSTCWVAPYPGSEMWEECEGADFETLVPLSLEPSIHSRVSYSKDAAGVWFHSTRVENADPATVYLLGENLLTDGKQVWHGAGPIEARADEIAYISTHFTGRPDYLGGALVHQGDRIVIYDIEKGPKTVARAKQRDGQAIDALLTNTLSDLFSTMFAVFSNFAPLLQTPGEIDALIDKHKDGIIQPDAVPTFKARLTAEGQVELLLSDGTILQQPISCWYTLGCHLWCYAHKITPMFLPYPPLGTIQPDSIAMHLMLIRRHRSAMWQLLGEVFREGHEIEARLLAHFCFFHVHKHEEFDKSQLQELADLPRELMNEFQYEIAHYQFNVTTNLAVGRLIIDDHWLESENFRDRLDVINTLHSNILDTNKLTNFFEEIVPVLLDRFDKEPLPAIREHLAMTLEAALISGQVDCEVNRNFHHADMLPVIKFCISRGINSIFNRARLAEALWALDENDEANTVAEDLICEIGENTPLPGIYNNRLMYRTPRLWFLRGKTEICYQKASTETHNKRLDSLQKEYADLLSRYGKEASKWDEMKGIFKAIERYHDVVQNCS